MQRTEAGGVEFTCSVCDKVGERGLMRDPPQHPLGCRHGNSNCCLSARPSGFLGGSNHNRCVLVTPSLVLGGLRCNCKHRSLRCWWVPWRTSLLPMICNPLPSLLLYPCGLSCNSNVSTCAPNGFTNPREEGAGTGWSGVASDGAQSLSRRTQQISFFLPIRGFARYVHCRWWIAWLTRDASTQLQTWADLSFRIFFVDLHIQCFGKRPETAVSTEDRQGCLTGVFPNYTPKQCW